MRDELASKMLRVTSALWWGRQIVRGGEAIGPGFTLQRLSSNVRGSLEAEKHATHARIHNGFVWGTAIAALGLLGGAIAAQVALKSDGGILNNDTARGPYIGAVCGVLFESGFVTWQEQEIAKAESAYNYDLVRGTLR